MRIARSSLIALAVCALSASLAGAQAAKDYGKPLTLKVTTPISSILKDPKAFEGKRVQVEGLIVEVCEERGCWIKIASDKPFESIRFKVAKEMAKERGTLKSFDETKITGPVTDIQIMGDGARVK